MSAPITLRAALTFAMLMAAPSAPGSGQNKRPSEAPTLMGIDEDTGILLEGASHCGITGNTFSGPSSAAVWSTSPCKGMLVTVNVAPDCGRKLPQGVTWFDLGATTTSP